MLSADHEYQLQTLTKVLIGTLVTFISLLFSTTSAIAQNSSTDIQPMLLSHGGGVVHRDTHAFLQRDFDEFTAWLKQEMAEQQLPGLAMAIVSSRGILSMETWGVRAVGKPDPVDSETIFRIASVSKTFAGTVAAQLVLQNAYQWDEPLIKILPQYKLGTDVSGQSLTLRHIMSHSTGLMPHAFSNMLDAGVSYQKIQEKLHEIPVVCQPGSCYGYQNVVFSLVSDVVQVQTQKTYEQFVRENIFTPLGMRTASLSLEEYLASANASEPHQRVRANSWRVATTNAAYYTTGPASGINASITDMTRWAQANLGAFPQVLPPALLEVQHAPVVETPYGSYFNRWPKLDKAYYGLGWRIFDYAGMRVVHHGGGVRGFRTEMVLIPEKDLALVILFNAETPVANDVVPSFLDQVMLKSDLLGLTQ